MIKRQYLLWGMVRMSADVTHTYHAPKEDILLFLFNIKSYSFSFLF